MQDYVEDVSLIYEVQPIPKSSFNRWIV